MASEAQKYAWDDIKDIIYTFYISEYVHQDEDLMAEGLEEEMDEYIRLIDELINEED